MSKGNHITLELDGVSKEFPGVKALDAVLFNLYRGEVHALCGENGAGKSTLMNILSGNLEPDQGRIRLYGREVRIEDPRKARSLGIGIVHQENSLTPNLSVADNIFVAGHPRNRWGLIDRDTLNRQARGLLNRLGLNHIHPNTPVERLSTGQRQMVEIAKALSQEPDILILDEPTATISERDTLALFLLIRTMTRVGSAVIYITHRLQEVFAVADRVTVLKDGRYQGTLKVKETGVAEIVRMMVGRDLKAFDYRDDRQSEELLEVQGLCGDGFVDVSLTLRRGEILGLAGLVGAGRSEFCRALVGADRVTKGTVRAKGKVLKVRHTGHSLAQGIGYLPENRKELGLFMEMDLVDNMQSVHMNASRSGWTSRERAARYAEQQVQQLDIRTPSVYQKVRYLSGGNQQKVVLAKWLLTEPDILLIDEPTAGIDVGAKSEIYALINGLTERGTGVILVSSDLPELIGIADRIAVMYQGRVAGVLDRDQFSEEGIMYLASGQRDMESPVAEGDDG